MPRPGLSQGRCGFTFPLIVHLVLAYPAGRARSAPARALSAAAYVEALLAAAVLALFRDPYFDPGCLANCNVNIFLARSLPSLARADEIADRWFPAAAAVGLIAICAARLVADRGPPGEGSCRSPSPRSCLPARCRRGQSRSRGPRPRTR